MPNWTTNTICMDNICNMSEIFTKAPKGGYYGDPNEIIDWIDFNKIIPEPTSPDGLDDRYIRHPNDSIEEIEDKPWFNWYTWHLDNWGTKWNACHMVPMDPDYPDEITFDTAWTDPRPIFIALSKKYPDRDLEARCIYEDEDEFEYITVFRNGEEISSDKIKYYEKEDNQNG